MTRMFTCAGCRATFVANNTMADRDADAIELYAGTIDEPLESVCSACHLKALEIIKADPGRVEADRAQERYVKMTRK